MKDKAMILVVDDQRQNIELMEAFLEPAGYGIVSAASGEEVLELLARVRSLLKVKAYNDLMSNYRSELEAEVSKRTLELNHALERIYR